MLLTSTYIVSTNVGPSQIWYALICHMIYDLVWSTLISMVIRLGIWNLAILVVNQNKWLLHMVWPLARCQVDQSEAVQTAKQLDSSNVSRMSPHLLDWGQSLLCKCLQVRFTSDSPTKGPNGKTRQEWISSLKSGWQTAFQPVELQWPVALIIRFQLLSGVQ